jgi:hypothetical protein
MGKGGGQIDTGRERLGFADAVRSAFAFVRKYGFVELEAGPTIVKFGSRDVDLTVYHGRSSYEIGVEIGWEGNSAPGFTLSEVIRLADESEGARYRNPAATTLEGVRDGVTSAAVLLSKHGDALLAGDLQSFSRLQEQRKRWGESYALDVLAGQLRPRAEAAFRQGRYAEAADIYERIRPRLSPAEVKKLELAKRRRAAGS